MIQSPPQTDYNTGLLPGPQVGSEKHGVELRKMVETVPQNASNFSEE